MKGKGRNTMAENEGYVRDQGELSLLRSYRRLMQAEEDLARAKTPALREQAARNWLDADAAIAKLCCSTERMGEATSKVLARWTVEREQREGRGFSSNIG